MLSLEPFIAQRLRDSVPELMGVHGVVRMMPEDTTGKQLPAAFVASEGHRVVEVTGQGSTARIASRWMVVVAVRNVAGVRDGHAARLQAAPLVLACLRALMGWQLRPDVQALHPVTSPAPLYKDGLLLYPLSFECAAAVHALSL